MKLAAAFVAGLVLSIAVAMPRVLPEVRYFADGDSLYYHANAECPHGAVIPLAGKKEAEWKHLEPCPFCFPEDHRFAKK